MKQLKNRKTLTLVLCLVLVSVFTLTIAYSALSAVLTIQGNARVSAADWDIYLNNPRVTSGSATTNVPVIKTSSTLEFETTLNMPGDFYEFVVDVVNAGDIDAMIENVVKTPELTTEQAKFLKYEVSYQNGESITTKQLLAKDTTMPIKVRIEYRKDLNNTDLPTSQIVLDLALTLEYVQSDGTGNSVKDNGVQIVSANGDINEIGTVVTIGSEQFYTVGTDGDNVKLLSMYNLYVGGTFVNGSGYTAYGDEATGKQNAGMSGWISQSTRRGTTVFSNTNSSYAGSVVEGYVNNYKEILESEYGISIIEARLFSKAELESEDIGCTVTGWTCSAAPSFIYDRSYWIAAAKDASNVWFVHSNATFYYQSYSMKSYCGVRPIIVISKDYFN